MSIRVAIFEDNKLIRDAYEAILHGSEGFLCAGAFSDCNRVSQAIKRSEADVVLMDIEMPGIDGIEATKQIHRDFPHVKILIQTVFEDDDKIFKAICAGASGYILKSNGLTQLLNAILEVHNGGAPMSPVVAARVLRLFQKFAPPLPSKQEIELSPREKEILSLIVEGYDFHTIAKKIFISYETVKTHVKKVYKKLHVASATEAVALAIRQRLV